MLGFAEVNEASQPVVGMEDSSSGWKRLHVLKAGADLQPVILAVSGRLRSNSVNASRVPWKKTRGSWVRS